MARDIKHTVILPTGRVEQRKSPRVYTHAIVTDDRVGLARDIAEAEAELAALGEITEADREELARLKAELATHNEEQSARFARCNAEAEQQAAASGNLRSYHYFMDRTEYGRVASDPVTGTNERYAAIGRCRARRFDDLTKRLKQLRESDGCGVYGWSQSAANAAKMAATARKARPRWTVTVMEATRHEPAT